MPLPLIPIEYKHLRYDANTLTLVGMRPCDKTYEHRVMVIGQKNRLVFKYIETGDFYDDFFHYHRQYTLELYWDKEAMDNRWRELRGVTC